MTDNSPPTADPATSGPVLPPPGRRPWQVGLRTMALLIVAVAVWTSYGVNRRSCALLETRISAMRPLARELIVADDTRIAVVKQEEFWFDENRWEIHLPEGRYRVCLATRGIDKVGTAAPVRSGLVGGGRHQFALEQAKTEGGWRVTVSWDEAGRLVADEPAAWDPASGSVGGGQYSESTQFPSSMPVVLFRRRFTPPARAPGSSMSPMGPTEGILLWIEPIAGP